LRKDNKLLLAVTILGVVFGFGQICFEGKNVINMRLSGNLTSEAVYLEWI
jgi:hypothetical protein